MSKKRMSKRIVETATAQYEAGRSVYIEWASKLSELLTALLKEAGISHEAIEHRAKTVESLREKLVRPSKLYANGLADITDLCGLRLITYTLSDVRRACELLERQFTVESQYSVDKAALLAPEEFGYRSRHLVVQLRRDRAALPEWKRFAGLLAEIQVRTVLEHAWAAIDHALRYKRDADVPREQKRNLFRLSALLELADESFDNLVQGQGRLREEAERRLASGTGDSPELNGVSYEVYAKEAQALRDLMKVALACGFTDAAEFGEIPQPGEEPDTESQLIAVARGQGLRTVRDLDDALISETGRAAGYLRALVERSREGPW